MGKKKQWALLGKTCKDIITGYEGICTSVFEHLYGCEQYALKPKSKENSKSLGAFFFEEQLEIIDDGVREKVTIPEYTESNLFGKECVDKITGIKGICVGRLISLFNCDQIVIEQIPEDKSNEPRVIWLDEGRIELAPEPSVEINPEDVQGSRPGGLLDASEYPHISHARTIIV